jgi:hypothetical protein
MRNRRSICQSEASVLRNGGMIMSTSPDDQSLQGNFVKRILKAKAFDLCIYQTLPYSIGATVRWHV